MSVAPALVRGASSRLPLTCSGPQNAKEPNADEIAMLLANLAKDESTARILTLARAVPKGLSTSSNAMDQLMDCFVKGAEQRFNKHASFDYLSYFFADIAKVRPPARTPTAPAAF